mgnify:CR=1 FL=1
MEFRGLGFKALEDLAVWAPYQWGRERSPMANKPITLTNHWPIPLERGYAGVGLHWGELISAGM